MPRCPRGHDTAAADYCDQCGSPLSVVVSPAAASPASTGDKPCPGCETTQTGRFCEICGRDRQVGATAEALKARAAPAPDAATATGTPNGWLVVTWANRDYHAHMIASASQFAELVDIPDNYPKRHFILNGSQLLIGRRSRSRGIEPDIDLIGPPEDPGVSHTHALLVANPDGGWSLVDIESANGTYTFVDGQYKRIETNQPVPLKDGDQIYLGAWTALTLRSRFNKRRGLPR
jgi:FHA domain